VAAFLPTLLQIISLNPEPDLALSQFEAYLDASPNPRNVLSSAALSGIWSAQGPTRKLKTTEPVDSTGGFNENYRRLPQEETVQIGLFTNKAMTGLFGGERFFQTTVSGWGKGVRHGKDV
jgi:hypothetical protein